MSGRAIAPQRFTPPEVAYVSPAQGERKAIYEHSFAVRLTHWLNAIALFVMAGSGLRIYLAFPAFGDKLPPRDFFTLPGRYSIGGWLGGALQWHFTFMWLFLGGGLLYVCYQVISGGWPQVLFLPRDVRGVWPMFRHYFLFGPKPPQTESYNSLQKLAYTGTILLAVLSTITGLILFKSAQLAWLIPLLGGYRSVRVLHFLALLGFLAFIPGHIVMVLVHGWNNFQSMLTGWNFKPAYATSPLPVSAAQAVRVIPDELPTRTAAVTTVETGSAAAEPQPSGKEPSQPRAAEGDLPAAEATDNESQTGSAGNAEPQSGKEDENES